MVVTLASFKGGVSKTTSAVHLAAFLQEKGSTLLIDGDPNRSATGWAKRADFLFTVLDVSSAKGKSGQYTHVVIDTEARPTAEDMKALADQCDLLVIPTTPDALALDALMQTLEALQGSNYKVLLTIVPPKPSKAGEEVRAVLKKAGWPVFKSSIRRLAAFPKAAMIGCLVQDVPDPRAGLGWQDYQALGRELYE